MIFVVEKMFRDHQARVATWERARDKYKEKYDYYSNRDYENRYPRPGHTLKVVGKAALFGLAIGAVIALAIALTFGGDNHDKKHQGHAATVQKKEAKPAEFKVGDKVQVVYGDYEDSVGVIIRLTDDGDTIIKLTNSTFTHAMCNASSSCNSGDGHDNGELLGIASLKNLVPYKEVK